MADIKITNLPLGTDIADDDELLYIDVSDQTAGPDGTDKRVLIGSLRNIVERNATTEDLIASDLSSFAVGKSITTVGFYESGDGGGTQWVKTAETDTPSQTPAQLGDVKFTDSDGAVWEYVFNGVIYINKLGAVGDGESDSADHFEAAFNGLARLYGGIVHIPTGKFCVYRRIITEAFDNVNLFRRRGIAIIGDSVSSSRVLVRNNDGFFAWLQTNYYGSTNANAANNISFLAQGFTVEMQASLSTASNDNGRIIDIRAAGSANHHWMDVTIRDVDILSLTGQDYLLQGIFIQGVPRNIVDNVNITLPYGTGVTTEIQEESDGRHNCTVSVSNNNVSCVEHGFKIGNPVRFSGITSVNEIDERLTLFVSETNYTVDSFQLCTDPGGLSTTDITLTGSDGSGEVFNSTACVFVYQAGAPNVKRSRFWGTRTGVRFEENRSEGGEGGYIGDSVCDSQVGAFFYSLGVEPGLAVKDTHFNCSKKGLHIVNKRQIHINGNIWYAEENEEYEDITLENCVGANIRDILFIFGDTPLRTNVLVGSGCEDITIKDLDSRCSNGTLVKVLSGAVNTHIIGSTDNSDGGMILVNDSGTNTKVSYHDTKAAQTQLSANQLIPNNTETELLASVERYNNGGWISGGKITVPTGLGIKQVEVSASTLWASNSTGYRALYIKKNGGQVVGGGAQTSQSITANEVVSVSSGIISVVDGDEITVTVRQTSGGDLSVLNNQSTYLSVKVV